MLFDNAGLAHNLYNELLVKDDYRVRQLFGRKIDTVVDIGANYGLFSLMTRIMFPEARVICVEPNPPTFAGLQKNLASLKCEFHQLALGEGRVKMVNVGVSSGTRMTAQAEGLEGIEALSLPKLMERLNVDPSKNVLLKIDTEGAERYLMGDQESEAILKAAEHYALELHFQHGRWPNQPTKEQYGAWVCRLFQESVLTHLNHLHVGNNIGIACGTRVR